MGEPGKDAREDYGAISIAHTGRIEYGENPFKEEGISIKRDSDLQEISWALQGAGTIFRKSASGQKSLIELQRVTVLSIRETLKTLKERDLKEDLNSLLVLKQELTQLHNAVMGNDEEGVTVFDLDGLWDLGFISVEKLTDEQIQTLWEFKSRLSRIIGGLKSEDAGRAERARRELRQMNETKTVSTVLGYLYPMIKEYEEALERNKNDGGEA